MPQGKQCSPKTLQEIEVHLENKLSQREVAGTVGVSREVIQNVIRRLQNGSSDYKEDQAEVEKQQLELTDISNLLFFEIAKSLCKSFKQT